MTPTRVRTLAGLALASTLLLTGCGAVPAFSPGVAARVDDDTITLDQVDEMTTSYCAAAEQQLQPGQVLPEHYLRGQVAGSLALRSAADQFAGEQGVTPDESYEQAVQRAQTSLKDLPADQAQAIVDVQGASIYVQAVEKAAGEQILSAQGKSASSSGQDAAQTAGQKAFRSWLADQDVRLDPRFGVSISSGQVATTDTSLSYALGDTAKSADADQPDSTYAAGLPDTQRCG